MTFFYARLFFSFGLFFDPMAIPFCFLQALAWAPFLFPHRWVCAPAAQPLAVSVCSPVVFLSTVLSSPGLPLLSWPFFKVKLILPIPPSPQ